MKNLIKNTKKGILMVAMMSTIIGFADESKLIVGKDSKKTALLLKDVKQGNLISIKDESGITLYKESVETTGIYKKGFDLRLLPDGNYFFEIDKDLETNTIPFTVQASKVLFDKKDESTIFKPYTRLKDGLVYVTKLSLNSEAIKISVYEERQNSYELVYTETDENVISFEKILKLENGNYKIVINTNNKVYTEFINN